MMDPHCANGSSEPAVVEVFSNTARAWFVAVVIHSSAEVLTVRFMDSSGHAREKGVYNDDPRLAPFGTHVGLSLLPPGFDAVPSSTRPGEVSYLDLAGRKKYASPALAWQAYLE